MFNYWLTMITPMIHHEPWVPGKAVTWDGFPRPDFDTKKWKTTGNPPAIYGIITMAFTIYHYHGNMVSYGIIWYHMVSHGITWYHMVSHGITWYHMVSHGITWYHRVKSLWPHRCSSVFQWVIDPGPEDNNPSKLQEVIRGALDLRW